LSDTEMDATPIESAGVTARFEGGFRVELDGIEPTTSCLQRAGTGADRLLA
jgi:hypothetical protein